MFRSLALALLVLLATSIDAPAADAQAWNPGAREMPLMPERTELSGDWLTSRAQWFNGLQEAAGVAPSELRATGEGRSASNRTQVVRFANGTRPAMTWSDRNGDGRADIIEVFRNGVLIHQLIDADYSGRANVLRTYDSQGTLVSETRL
jgi:hypothetical protein